MPRKPTRERPESGPPAHTAATPRSRLAGVLAKSADAVSLSSAPRQQLTLLFRADTARRLRDHCAATNQELSGWVDRAVTASLDAAGIGTADGKPKRRVRPK
jgi:hypothetical protein